MAAFSTGVPSGRVTRPSIVALDGQRILTIVVLPAELYLWKDLGASRTSILCVPRFTSNQKRSRSTGYSVNRATPFRLVATSRMFSGRPHLPGWATRTSMPCRARLSWSTTTTRIVPVRVLLAMEVSSSVGSDPVSTVPGVRCPWAAGARTSAPLGSAAPAASAKLDTGTTPVPAALGDWVKCDHARSAAAMQAASAARRQWAESMGGARIRGKKRAGEQSRTPTGGQRGLTAGAIWRVLRRAAWLSGARPGLTLHRPSDP